MAYKTFTNGDVLNASEINDNLMNQSVMVFFDASSRTAAIPAPVEGMVTYLEFDDTYYSYTGSNWIPLINPGTWKSYTPTFTNFTLGNGTVNTAKYSQVGKTITLQVFITLGSTSSVGSQPTFSLPVNSNTNYLLAAGNATMAAGGANYLGSVYVIGSTQARMFVLGSAAAFLGIAGVSATQPGTWATGNSFGFTLVYEAA